MAPDEFIAGLRAFVIDANATHYDEFYSTFPPEHADTPFLKGVVKLYADLSPEQRDVVPSENLIWGEFAGNAGAVRPARAVTRSALRLRRVESWGRPCRGTGAGGRCCSSRRRP